MQDAITELICETERKGEISLAMLSGLIEMSNKYGSNCDFIVTGGGNTSYKQDGILYIKESGAHLGNIKEDGFVAMDNNSLLDIMATAKPATEEAAGVLIKQAILPEHYGRCPSVESLLHAMFNYAYVLHLHPAIVNGFTCSVDGANRFNDVFAGRAVWVDSRKPGFMIAQECFKAFQDYKQKTGGDPQIAFVQNHGVFVAANTTGEADSLMLEVVETITGITTAKPDYSQVAPPQEVQQVAPELRMLYSPDGRSIAVHQLNKEIMEFISSADNASGLSRFFTPDHYIFFGSSIMYAQGAENIAEDFADFTQKYGHKPKLVMVKGLGVFGLGETKQDADMAVNLFLDMLSILVYSKSFGGPRYLEQDIEQAVKYGEGGESCESPKVCAKPARRMEGKVCIVTGGAQGFGEGIARGIASQGGYVAVADMNLEGACKLADELCTLYGAGSAIGVQVNVADENAVKAMVEKTVLAYGGLDLMVACAGILIAGSLAELSKDSFEKVTAVNYGGYFLCAKYASETMVLQRKTSPAYTADIIEINSKSGLEGSKKNFAYAGSKFGGIGLTQSFALELAEYGIKVNAICPGNLLDGPLWSDPERGLFRQYLDTGKVPGAKTLEDVRRFYESKVPMNRGCTVEDVATAVFYLVEQQYETGQALPVTGGQVMLS